MHYALRITHYSSRITFHISRFIMSIVYAILALVLGLIAGFVINVVATRLAANRPFFGPLRCTRSPHPITFVQALPVLGYVLQRGKCATCSRSLSLSFPATEAAT